MWRGSFSAFWRLLTRAIRRALHTPHSISKPIRMLSIPWQESQASIRHDHGWEEAESVVAVSPWGASPWHVTAGR